MRSHIDCRIAVESCADSPMAPISQIGCRIAVARVLKIRLYLTREKLQTPDKALCDTYEVVTKSYRRLKLTPRDINSRGGVRFRTN
jgi:hypothetical protein